MELVASAISCGVFELDGVGTHPTDTEYDCTMAYNGGTCAIVIASVPADWTNAVKFLKRKGFKQTLRQNRNPNSGNKIALFAKNVTKKERARFNALYSKLESDGDDYDY